MVARRGAQRLVRAMLIPTALVLAAVSTPAMANVAPGTLATANAATAIPAMANAAMANAGAGAGAASRPVQACGMPAAGKGPGRAEPSAMGFDPGRLAKAVAFADSRLRLNVQVYRHNCLVAEGSRNAVTGTVPWNIWSATKSVVSMLAGIAVSDGRLDPNAPIGRYLPAGQGDAAHRAITVRDLLTETSGLKQSIVSEAVPSLVGADPDIVAQTLALPIVHRPGTYFEYSQRTPDLLAYIVQRAVGQDLQTFAQRRLFGPIGIPASDYFWLRDRSGHTYGHANLYLPPNAFARLGTLMLNNGRWNATQLIAPGYVRQVSKPTKTNPCYGYLFWTNHAPCVGPSIPSRKTFAAPPLQGMPSDSYAMVGFLQQNNFLIPSLGIQVTWTGVLGDASLDPQTLISASPSSELYYNFMRLLGRAITTPHVPDPGPYRQTFNLDVRPDEFADPAILLGTLGIGPDAPRDCNILFCHGTVPLHGTAQNVEAILRALLARITRQPH
ncbi:serine hydrolase [Actinomadura barringtoniae]|uniref:Serine hydrolase n=1 Tax=Actinomadura barringtoniae TaxID=1427535 RepID=A0A939PIC4_9ACTN|nr:serine hydrolase [Actinomadura barringtoniae]MBO2449719.1 serine hydrolase [Actinomadura barringtoniae]